MPKLTLRSFDTMPAVGLGLWKIPKSVTAKAVYEAIRDGYRHLDCACDYGNEVEVGKGIACAIKDGIVTREVKSSHHHTNPPSFAPHITSPSFPRPSQTLLPSPLSHTLLLSHLPPGAMGDLKALEHLSQVRARRARVPAVRSNTRGSKFD